MEFYLTFLRQCRDFNERNLIDPTTDKMEWNHTLPQCLFKGHGPGQWLTLKQHAIASALQTLVFQTNCLHGAHLPHLPLKLRELVKDVRNRTLFTPEHQSKAGKLGGAAGRGRPKILTDEIRADFPRRLEKARAARTSEGLARGGRAAGSLNGKKAIAMRFQCTVTGFISTAPALARYQKARGIDASNRIRIDNGSND